MPLKEPSGQRILELLRPLYGNRAEDVLRRVNLMVDRYGRIGGQTAEPPWSEQTILLITYGDQVQSSGQAALEAQRRFLLEYDLDKVISGVHILPFFPYSSDDGFSVIDYRDVDPQVGDWQDVARFGESFDMMFDFVINHCSRRNDWFRRYVDGEKPYVDYFIEVDPEADLSAVTRPRATPLLTPLETSRGTKHVWTTFSADQVDLNFANPEVLLEMLDVLLFYVQQGAGAIRLDAIGFLWKRIATTCMHLPQTHAVVKILRALLEDVAPRTVLITETNVPHEENVSYFGDGDEAHAVYQFSLAPLLLDAFLTGDAGPLNNWLSGLEYPGEGMTFFNFTASHDGIGVRPLEGLVSQQRIDAMVQNVRRRGGLVSTRRSPDGRDVPYELNITYFSAMDSADGLLPEDHARRFLASQAMMLALCGIPGIYFHSLVGTPNDHEGVRRTGHNRSINRRKFDAEELRGILTRTDSAQSMVFDSYRRLLSLRVAQPAFHPDAQQTLIQSGQSSMVVFTRTSQPRDQRIIVATNVGEQPARLDLSPFRDSPPRRDLISEQEVEGDQFELGAFQTAWLV